VALEIAYILDIDQWAAGFPARFCEKTRVEWRLAGKFSGKT
jgi:hypothetical protein